MTLLAAYVAGQSAELVAGGGGSGLLRATAAKGVSLPWLPLLPLFAIPFVGTSPESLDRIIIAMQLTFLLMAVRNPVWMLPAVALSELTIRNYFLTVPVALVIGVSHLVHSTDLGPKARPLLTTAALLTAVSAVATLVADASAVVNLLQSVLPDLAVLVLIPLAIRSREDLLQAGIVVLAIAGTSAAIAIAQQGGDPRFLAVPHHTALSVDMMDWGDRALGLDLNPILLTDHLMLLLFPAVGLLLTGRVSRRAAMTLLLLIAVMAAALFLTQTRSWILAAVAAMAGMAFVLRGRMGRELIVVVLIAGVGFWYWANQTGSRYGLGPENDASAAARPVLWNAALAMAVDHPVLGVGYDKFQELSPEYANIVDPALLERQDAGSILGREDPHNDFLNVWASYGTGALVLYLLFLAFTAGNFLSVARDAPDPVLRGIALGCFGALVAFGVNSFFHNLLTSALTLWILAGVSIALVKVALLEEAPPHPEV